MSTIRKSFWVFGYELDDGEFNELGGGFDYDDVKRQVDDLNDPEVVIRERVAVSTDRCHKKWKVRLHKKWKVMKS